MGTSAIILAGGLSKRFGQNKGLALLAGKPLVKYVVDAVRNLVDEVIIVVNSETQVENFKILRNIQVIVDELDLQGPLIGALTGFKATKSEYALLLPCDAPFASKDVLSLLLDLCIGVNAVIPRWPNGYIEPLHAAYRVEAASSAAEAALREGRVDMKSMIERLRRVRYISTLVLSQLDPDLRFFFNVNTPLDLKKAERMLQKSKRP
ncbi:molybdenum cofactor guanylyltransferase [Candidatus Bathyarchaeota archaeon]|nr:molybdenum cofactor guanylyltransferase [Candidatus Bathyarchaeota archaeon]